MGIRQTTAAFVLLTSTLLGGLAAPLSHFAFMVFSDAYAMHGTASHAMTAQIDGAGLDTEDGSGHVECPFAAFFLNQASAVSGSSPGLAVFFAATCPMEAPVHVPYAAPKHISPIRGPPGQPA